MTKTATFSNGHTDTYKGDRNVTAAWMVVLPNGKIMSGHSNNLPTAAKTARTNAAQRFYAERTYHQHLKPLARWAHMQGYVRGKLKEYGFKTVREHDAALTDDRNAFVATCKIEVVAL
jgi:hypothetical protein